MDLVGRSVAVVGLGRSGASAARLARARGAPAVTGFDARPDAPLPDGVLRGGPLAEDALVGFDVVVVSPGVAAAHPAVAAAIDAGVDVVGELGFAARWIDAPIVAITGTNGKSTVTTWTGALLATEGRRVFVGGNLGVPLSEAALEGGHDLCVVEVSSYQLELPGPLHPAVAALLNLTPDHLARHGTMEVYAATKARLVARQTPGDLVLVPPGEALLVDALRGVGQGRRAWLGGLPGVVREGARVRVALDHLDVAFDLSALRVAGAHNLDHAATAACLALAAGASPAAIQAALPGLRALPHRMQPVHEEGGVLWIDDSKATNLASTRVAVEGLERQAVVLLGGEAKGPGFGALAAGLRRHRAVVTFGASGPAIAGELEAAGLTPVRVDRLSDAVEAARRLARPGDAVLLSPAAASFDEFDDFAHRGRVFAALAAGGHA